MGDLNRARALCSTLEDYMGFLMTYDPSLDAEIQRYVETLNAAGIETFESCQGSPGHSYPEPTIRFHGERAEGFRALAVALQHNFPVAALRRIWRIIDREPIGPS
jgi:hypothetical protein